MQMLLAAVNTKAKSKTIRNRKAFLKWLKKSNPKAYRIIMQRVGINVMGATNDPVASPSIWDKIVSTASQVLPTIVQAKAQSDIFNAQLKRAKKGLPPLKTAEIAPTVRIQADISKETRQAVSTDLTDMLKKLAVPALIGGGLLTVVLLKKKRR